MTSPPIVVVLQGPDMALPAGDPAAPAGSAPALVAEAEGLAELRRTDAAGLADALDGADALYVFDFSDGTVASAWHAADTIRWVHIASTGVDRLMFPALRESGAVVTNSRGLYERPIAEYVLAQILAFAKDLHTSRDLQHHHRWRHRVTERVSGTSALVAGTGPIGRETARLLRAAGIRVVGSGRTARADDPDFGTVVGPEDLHATLGTVDWVVAVAPLTESTHHLFDAAAFAAMRPTARLINVGRGGLVVTDDLVEAVRTGSIAGAALDVVDPEPLPDDHPLWSMPTVSITPHHSGDTAGWHDDLVAVFVDRLRRWVRDEPLPDVVDTTLGYVPS